MVDTARYFSSEPKVPVKFFFNRDMWLDSVYAYMYEKENKGTRNSSSTERGSGPVHLEIKENGVEGLLG
jgi:hypothetical protein